jgi:branched-chain amino acid transport system ATP-binding protein
VAILRRSKWVVHGHPAAGLIVTLEHREIHDPQRFPVALGQPAGPAEIAVPKLDAQGTITYCGERIDGMAPHRIVQRGLCHVPEGRMVFGNLTVRENLAMGAYLQRDQDKVRRERDYVFSIFPRLAEREKQLAGTLSGGEQQMLAIGRALMSAPKFLMLDEPSLGIAPLLVKAIFAQIRQINRDRGITILLVEQNANLALEIASHGFVLETGQVILENDSATLRADSRVRSAYLGG